MVVLAAGIVIAGVARPRLTEASREVARPPAAATRVYRSPTLSGALVPTPHQRRVVFAAGRVGAGGDTARGLEALLRLHGYLGLRDVHPAGVVLHWQPAYPASQADEAEANACAAPGETGASVPPRLRLASGDHEDLLGRPAQPHRELRVFLFVEVEDNDLRVVASTCTPRGTRNAEVFFERKDQEGRLLRELLTWLAHQTGVDDTSHFLKSWARPATAPGPASFAYREVLTESIDPGARDRGPSSPTLSQAERATAEAAWLAAWLGPQTLRRERLQRATELRPFFTAAIEDLGALYLQERRVDLALAALERLPAERERSRPVEQILAAEALARGEAHDARRLLGVVPSVQAGGSAMARLLASAELGAGNPKGAVAWSEAWRAAEPESPDALLMHGDVLDRLGRLGEAEETWLQAAKLDPRARAPALRRLGVQLLARGEGSRLLDLLDAAGQEGPLGTELLELRAYIALRAGPGFAARAYKDYAALAGPDAPDRIAFNRCVAALRAGLAPETGGPCAGLRLGSWEGHQLRAAWASRRPGLLPNYPPDVGQDVRQAFAEAPLTAESADAMLRLAGPRADRDERRQLTGWWRVAVGPDVPLPALPAPRDPNRPLDR